VKELLGKYPATTEYMLDMLHDLQDAEPKNYLKPEALQAVADYVSVPMSEVVSTATFYTMYSLKPRGKHVIRFCESPPCQLVGAESLIEILSEILNVEVGETTEDGVFTLETASCRAVRKFDQGANRGSDQLRKGERCLIRNSLASFFKTVAS